MNEPRCARCRLLIGPGHYAQQGEYSGSGELVCEVCQRDDHRREKRLHYREQQVILFREKGASVGVISQRLSLTPRDVLDCMRRTGIQTPF